MVDKLRQRVETPIIQVFKLIIAKGKRALKSQLSNVLHRIRKVVLRSLLKLEKPKKTVQERSLRLKKEKEGRVLATRV